MKDYYGILDLPPHADCADIRKAFRALALMCHPDLAKPDLENAASAFMEIREAYEVLIDPERRGAYDEKLAEQRRRAEAHARSTARVPVERPTARQAYSPGAALERLRKPALAELIPNDTGIRDGLDIFGSIEVDLEDSVKAGNYTVLLPRTVGGNGQTRKVLIRLPGKLFSGALLRVRDHGNTVDGQTGDLLIEVILRPHPNFSVRGEALFTDLAVKPWEAALGFEARIPTLEGFARIVMPPCPRTPLLHRLPREGLYNSLGERGDLWITIKVEIPEPATLRARRLWAELAEEFRQSQR